MTNSKNLFYKESGYATNLSLALVIACGIFSLIFLSMIYSMLIAFIPIVYFNILIVIGFGITISFVNRFFIRLFKIRNRKKALLLSVILGVIAVYLQWVWYIIFASSIELFSSNSFLNFVSLLFQPISVFDIISEIYSVGLWSIFTLPTLNGPLLLLVWIAEASIIIFMSYFNYSRLEEIPFSEKENTWYKKEFIEGEFEYISFKKEFIEQFQNNPFEAIKGLKKGDGIRHSRISVFKTDTESNNLIKIDNVIITQRGKGKEDIVPVLKPYYIDNQNMLMLRKNYNFKKTFSL